MTVTWYTLLKFVHVLLAITAVGSNITYGVWNALAAREPAHAPFAVKGIAFLLYYFMMNTLGATRATTVTFLVPVTAVFWGATLLREAITIPIVTGMAVILLGLYLTSRPRRSAAVLTRDRGVA